MKNSILTLVLLLGLILIVQSCNSRENNLVSNEDPFFEVIEASFPMMEVDSGGIVNLPSATDPYQITVSPDSEYLVVADRVSNSILLFDRKGQALLSKAGREGRGPAEFMTISQLHFGHDNQLYVMDILLGRITRFKIDSKELHYVTTFVSKSAQAASMRRVFVTSYGNFGVYHRIENHLTWEESFHLYRLDEEMTPVEHLMALPGNEKMKLDENVIINHFLGRSTYWDLDGEWFYYIESDSPEIHQYNIRTGERKSEQFFSLEMRGNSQQTIDFLINRMDTLIEHFPPAADAIQNSRTLPMFNSFRVRDNRFLFGIFNAGGNGGRMIYVNQPYGDVFHINMPSYFTRLAFGFDVIYGIEISDQEVRTIRVLDLNPV